MSISFGYRSIIVPVCTLLASCLLSSPASAQMPKMLRDLLPKAAPQNTNGEQPRRDPTQAQGELKELLSQPETNGNQPAPPTIPPIQLRGKIIGGKRAMALLSIGENNWLTVHAGQAYMLPGQAGMELRVVAITADRVEV